MVEWLHWFVVLNMVHKKLVQWHVKGAKFSFQFDMRLPLLHAGGECISSAIKSKKCTGSI